ncbi:M16 family metallopeptidase [Nonlabens ponticola]|uniref:Insulinase family protein n=1 Tax=Nonlabens ponticola TaxID=2496866 RepID=A0A3S9N147_9FLAO|nr:pitrilysin family protein [Nonlabens ponticola]AZQ42713.1 insulinase family protein [Nonlabens ponticola]AZQ45104.1 insulinase family protein [Nonlabens ponticola]
MKNITTMLKHSALLLVLLAFFITSCKQKNEESTTTNESLDVNIEKYTLDNGLTVVLHTDTSDPVVAVALTTHVGSAREVKGRTGFAHLFEHLLFLESENLGRGGLDAMSARIGGSGANGSTNRDRTNYYQTVPNDALEKMIWAEADKLGYFINTVTQPVLAKEKQVVKNEKRQGVDNQPYGHEDYVIDRNLYPENHPYHWQVIGSLEDLQNATLEDVKQFYGKYYTPRNTVLTIAGDFEKAQAKEWIEKYFGEIPTGEKLEEQSVPAVALANSKRLMYEDNFARLPQLSMTWPGVKQYSKDYYALNMLVRYMSDGKAAPLNQVLIDSLNMATRVSMRNNSGELAGDVKLTVRAFEEVDLDSVHDAVMNTFANYNQNPITSEALERIKTQNETQFYRGLSSVLGKGFQLAQYEIFAGDAAFINKDLENIKSVTVNDVNRVFKKYIKDKPYIATSFVPRGASSLALKDSKMATVVEEVIVNNANDNVDPNVVATYEKTPSSFDRSIEPAYGAEPSLKVPEVWTDSLSSGIKIYGITNDEVPLVTFNMEIAGGQLLEPADKAGAARLTALLMLKGTQDKSVQQLEEALDDLGTSINIFAGNESVTTTGTTLARNYDKTMELVEEILLQPRWDEEEFEILKKQALSAIEEQLGNPNAIASSKYYKALYGDDHVLSHSGLGTVETVGSLSINDLKQYYATAMAPSNTSFMVVGDIDQDSIGQSLTSLNERWTTVGMEIPVYDPAPAISEPIVLFYDVPGAKQSVLRFGNPSISAMHPDYYAVEVMNYRLGGGGFASQLMQQLREAKGYTYGIGSRFTGNEDLGEFTLSSGVRSNVTLESTALIRNILRNYANSYSDQDLEVTKSYMVKSSAREYETAGAKLQLLNTMQSFDKPADYALQQQQYVRNLTVEQVKVLAQQYINPDAMYYVIVGDAATQFERLKQLNIKNIKLIK